MKFQICLVFIIEKLNQAAAGIIKLKIITIYCQNNFFLIYQRYITKSNRANKTGKTVKSAFEAEILLIEIFEMTKCKQRHKIQDVHQKSSTMVATLTKNSYSLKKSCNPS
jgi:hypothetical protein